MATICTKIFGIKKGPATRRLTAALAVFAWMVHAEDNLLNTVKGLHTKNFTSETYFEPPNEQQVKTRLNCAEASPLPGGLLDLSGVTIELFDAKGKLESVVETPRCTFAPLEGWARSPGHVEIRSGDRRSHHEGDGFWLRQTNALLSISISNNVHTVIQKPAGSADASL